MQILNTDPSWSSHFTKTINQEWWKKEHILKMNKNTYKILQGTLKQAHQKSEKRNICKHMRFLAKAYILNFTHIPLAQWYIRKHCEDIVLEHIQLRVRHAGSSEPCQSSILHTLEFLEKALVEVQSVLYILRSYSKRNVHSHAA